MPTRIFFLVRSQTALILHLTGTSGNGDNVGDLVIEALHVR